MKDLPKPSDVPCVSCQKGYGHQHICDVPDYCPCDQRSLHLQPPAKSVPKEPDSYEAYMRSKPQRTTIVKAGDKLLWLSINGIESRRDLEVIGMTVDGRVQLIITNVDGYDRPREMWKRVVVDIPIDRFEYMLSNDHLRILREGK